MVSSERPSRGDDGSYRLSVTLSQCTFAEILQSLTEASLPTSVLVGKIYDLVGEASGGDKQDVSTDVSFESIGRDGIDEPLSTYDSLSRSMLDPPSPIRPVSEHEVEGPFFSESMVDKDCATSDKEAFL